MEQGRNKSSRRFFAEGGGEEACRRQAGNSLVLSTIQDLDHDISIKLLEKK